MMDESRSPTRFDRPGHYFPALLVVSRRDPVDSSPFARMQNIARTLVIVEP